jgi:hypothetical protein
MLEIKSEFRIIPSQSKEPAMRSSSVTITFLLACALFTFSARAAIHYVDVNSTNPVPPYVNWETAAVTIQDAENASASGDEILVTNGVYQVGGTADSRIAIFNASFVHSVHGPEVTIIQGYQPPGTTNGAGSMRCATLGAATLAGFTLTNGAAQGYGGGVYALDSRAVVSNSVVVENVAPSGGGVYSGGKVINCTIAGNLALGGYGGGTAFATLLDCTLITNKVTNLGFGGGAYQGTLTNCVLAGNSARSGGGARFSNLYNCTLSNNVATTSGGGAQECILRNCTLINNSAQNGGGCYSSTNLNCLLVTNSSTNGGGASGGVLNTCLLMGNSVTGLGGGAYDCNMTNCLLMNNSASKGGGAYSDQYVFTVNCTVVSNSAVSAGGVWFTYAPAAALNVLNDILYWNSATTDPDFHGDFGGTNNLAWCCNPAGLGNHSISNSPLFVDADHGDFRLSPGSPCINAGRNSYVTISTDMDGNPRIVGGTVDIGAFEFQNPHSVISYGWLQNHGLPTDGSADFDDTDGDGMNNWQEWVTNTDPTNSLSYLHMLAPDATNNAAGVTIHWQSAGIRYFLQRSTNLAGPFDTFATNFFAGVGIAAYRDASATNGGPYFYRVGVQP